MDVVTLGPRLGDALNPKPSDSVGDCIDCGLPTRIRNAVAAPPVDQFVRCFNCEFDPPALTESDYR